MRGNDSIAVLPPSIHPNGKKYKLLNTKNPNELKLPVKLPFKKILECLNLKEGDIK